MALIMEKMSFVLLLLIIACNNNSRDNDFWKTETRIAFANYFKQNFTKYDKFQNVIALFYKSEGDECYDYCRSVVIIKDSLCKVILNEVRYQCPNRKKVNIYTDSLSKSIFVDSIFTVLSKIILSSKSDISSGCIGCEEYIAFVRINNIEKTIAWDHGEKMFDQKHNRIGKVFNSIAENIIMKIVQK